MTTAVNFHEEEIVLAHDPLVANEPAPAVQLFKRGDAEVLEAFGQRVHVLLPGAATSGEVAFVEVEVPAGDGPPYHVHRREDETFFIRKGRFEFVINGERHEVEEGDVVYGPRNVPHTFRNIGDSDAVLQVLSVCAGFENFFRDCAGAFAANAGMDTIFQIAADHGLEFLPSDAPPVHTEGAMAPRITRRGEAEQIPYPGAKLSILVSNENTGELFTVVDGAAAPGDGPPPHRHSREDELFVIHEGEIAFGVGNESFTARAGDAVWAPRGTRHIFRCVSSTPAAGLVVILPGAFEGYFRDTAVLFEQGRISPDNMQQLFEKYGLEAVKPEI